MQFFSQRDGLDFLKKYRSTVPNENTRNVSQLFSTIIGERLATLHELKSIYTLEEAYILWEIVTVKYYNQWLAAEYERNKGPKK